WPCTVELPDSSRLGAGRAHGARRASGRHGRRPDLAQPHAIPPRAPREVHAGGRPRVGERSQPLGPLAATGESGVRDLMLTIYQPPFHRVLAAVSAGLLACLLALAIPDRLAAQAVPDAHADSIPIP